MNKEKIERLLENSLVKIRFLKADLEKVITELNNVQRDKNVLGRKK